MKLFSFLFFATVMASSFIPAMSLAQVIFGETDEPIEILSDTLEYINDEQHARFSGNVLARQGKTKLKCSQLDVFYQQSDEGGNIKNLLASGEVFIITSTGEEASAKQADYQAINNLLILEGDVILKQDENVISGPRVEIDTLTGRAKVSGGRVRTLLLQPSREKSQ